MKTSAVRALLLLPFLALGCGDQLEPGSKIDSFRVIAEQADQPYARPGETIELGALSFDPQDRPVTWAWASCANPSESSLEGCLQKISESGNPDGAVFAIGADMSTAKLQIPLDALDSLPPAARVAANVGVVSVACPGELSFGQGPGGLPFVCKDSQTARELQLDEFIVGIKRVTVREHDRNQNPSIARITFDGDDWPEDEVKEVGFCDRSDFEYASCPGQDKHQLAAVLTPESFESGQDELGRAFDEQLVVQYYATEGIFEHESKIGAQPETGWVARKQASGQTLRLWFVARDNRGGVSWAERRVKVR